MKPITLFRDMGAPNKKEDHPAFEKTINEGLNKARDIGYNQGVDAAISAVNSFALDNQSI